MLVPLSPPPNVPHLNLCLLIGGQGSQSFGEGTGNQGNGVRRQMQMRVALWVDIPHAAVNVLMTLMQRRMVGGKEQPIATGLDLAIGRP